MDFVIAIPSLKRFQTISERTIKTLLKYETPKDKIFVFCVEDEEQSYKAVLPDEIHLIVGVRGLVEQREFIQKYFPLGQQIVFMDDDIDSFMGLDKKPYPNIIEAFNRGFEACHKEDTTIFGIHAVANTFFMSNTISTSLKYLVGCCYGVINSERRQQPPLSDAEDFWRSCWYYKTEGKTVRLNFISPKTSYYKGSGGLAELRTPQSNTEGKLKVCQDFPEYAKIWYRKRTGLAEIRLRDSLKKKNKKK